MTPTNPIALDEYNSPESQALRERYKPKAAKDLNLFLGYLPLPAEASGREDMRFCVALQSPTCVGPDGKEHTDVAFVEVDAKTLGSYNNLVSFVRKRYGGNLFIDDVVSGGAVKTWPEELSGRGFETWAKLLKYCDLSETDEQG